MTTQIGLPATVITIPDPTKESFHPTFRFVSHAERTLDGTLRRHVAAQKREWANLVVPCTDAQRATLATELNRQANLRFVPPHGSSGTVQCDGYSQKQVAGNWEVTFTLREV